MSEWKPWIISIPEARRCLGGISRTKFYTTVLPDLDALAKTMGRQAATVKMGGRRLIFKDVLHRFIQHLAKA
jgi:hypothetical protein